MKHETDIK